MKRYFDFPERKEVVKIESVENSVIKSMSIEEIFGKRNEVIREMTKQEYIRVGSRYKRENQTNLTMTIAR